MTGTIYANELPRGKWWKGGWWKKKACRGISQRCDWCAGVDMLEGVDVLEGFDVLLAHLPTHVVNKTSSGQLQTTPAEFKGSYLYIFENLIFSPISYFG